MGDFPIEIVLALIGIAVPLGAFLWEFVLVGRKRLGYRVQMDTPVTGEIESVLPGVLSQLRPAGDGSGADLKDLSIVLVRIENSGATTIDTHDYGGPEAGRIGLHLHFPQRRVIGMAVTELSDPGLRDSLDHESGIGVREQGAEHVGIIDLPKVPLNRGDHYKILAILQRSAGAGVYPDPAVRGMIKGGRVAETRSRVGVSRVMVGLIAFLVVVIAGQFIVDAATPDPVPLGCAGGELTIIGSTAFAPVLRDAATAYQEACTGAEFEFGFEGSERGLDRLDTEGPDNRALLAISDGPKGVGYPALVQRPLAMSLFTMIVNPDTGIRDLTAAQIRDLYSDRVDNWKQLGGNDLSVRLINRYQGSGTRRTFEARLLDQPQPLYRDATCREIRTAAVPGPARCNVPVTEDMLREVAATPGAIGYSEFADAATAEGVQTIGIDGNPAGREAAINRAYPFWGVEYAYSYSDLPPGSLGAGFLRFLTDEAGQDILRAAGNTPCEQLANPSLCQPFP